MAVFAYVARSAQGEVVREEMEAENEQILRRLLREKGYWVTTVRQKSRGKAAAGGRNEAKRPFLASSKVKLNHLAVFCRQLAVLINAGVSLVRSLSVLDRQTQNWKLKSIIREIGQDVQEGMAMSRALAKHPKVFNNLFIGLVRAGEVGGVLDETLERMSTFLEKDVELRRKVKSAMMYPSIVGVVAIGIVGFLTFYIVPKFMDLFEELDFDKDKFPWPTMILSNISHGVLDYWYFAAGGLFLVITASRMYGNTKMGKRHFDWAKLKIPVLGPINHKVTIARFARTLGTLLSSGVPILQAMDTVAGAIDNSVISSAIMDARMAVREGERIGDPLERSGLFPPMVVHMISVGEETGALDQMLDKIADFYESEVDAALASLAAAIEPIMIVFLGFIVGFIVVAMFLPLVEVISGLSE